jgi:hypothetical protein
MSGRVVRLAAPFVALLLAGCIHPPTAKDYAAFRAADPKSILVVPAINRSVEVTAPDYYLSTITLPLAERGYYVFPVNLVKRVLEDDGLSDANLVHAGDSRSLGSMFGADAVLYVTIERWDSRYVVLSTTTTVSISYRLVDARSGQELWNETRTMEYSPQASGGGGSPAGLVALLIVQAVASAVEKAAPDYMPLARMANNTAVGLPHQGLPAGPHIDQYRKDQKDF